LGGTRVALNLHAVNETNAGGASARVSLKRNLAR
jgi:hypothetical protein